MSTNTGLRVSRSTRHLPENKEKNAILISEYEMHGSESRAARKAGIVRQTAQKWLRDHYGEDLSIVRERIVQESTQRIEAKAASFTEKALDSLDERLEKNELSERGLVGGMSVAKDITTRIRQWGAPAAGGDFVNNITAELLKNGGGLKIEVYTEGTNPQSRVIEAEVVEDVEETEGPSG